ncbi:uncharacterized protein LOC118194610 [Stegodyphus dumicola]|uniref:uncharacterized protein LOC118194610 n=1 Tax=Stegodyphus dumicola TaxID=202533 RepID=UPI0015AE94ED|nr:uncharacterized protein LOC118194610 [Stegodyphus dumicola]
MKNVLRFYGIKKDHILTIELMEYDTEDNVVDPCEAEKWSNYLDTYVTEENVSEEILALEQGLPVFYPRNLRKQQEYWKRKVVYVENLWKNRYSSKFLKNNPPLFSRKRKAEFASIKQSHSAGKVKNENVDISSTEAKENSIEYCENSNQNVPENQEILQENVELDDSHDSAMKKIEDIVEENIRTIALALEAVNDCVVSNTNDNLDDSINELNSIEIVQETSVLDLKNEITTECFYGDESAITEIGLNKDEIVSMQIESKFSSLNACNDEESSKDVLNRAKENTSSESKSESPSKTCHVGEDDPDCQIEMTIETPSHVIDTITVSDSPEETNTVSDSDSKEKKRSRGKETLMSKQIRIKNEKHAARQKCGRKMSDYAIRTRKNRIYQDYVKRRIKKNTLKSAHSNAHREKKSKQITRKSEEFDDVTFDYAYFSELSDEDKCQYLAMKYVIVQDDTEGAFKKDSYKVYFVQCCDTYVYRRDCLCRAKLIHKKISEIKTSNFNAWHRVWLDRYVTPAMLKFCSDWLLRNDPEKYKLVCLTISDCTKPPYIPYSKYKVRYYKTEQ